MDHRPPRLRAPTATEPVSQDTTRQDPVFPKQYHKIPEHVTQYLLDQSSVMDEESLYESSLRIEPKLPA
ncbi:hypothetical protein MC885_020339 [Smutsia gigantea]|nr:hypothetical protein MC885_020339 [Smutsia gigantea]